MTDFPSSVSCVSELVCEEEGHPTLPLASVAPPTSVYHVLLKVAPEFYHRFSEFRPTSPLYTMDPDGTQTLRISFVYKEYDIPRYATLVYRLKKRTSTSWNAQFIPYEAAPQPHQQNGIDWIKLYHIEFEPALYALEKALEEFYNLNEMPTGLSDAEN